ncbi:MAG TPA: hypothetical protein VFR70_06780 [Flavobacterium sp.]|nr:hypothetical protein [Flavobacterium sp.]
MKESDKHIENLIEKVFSEIALETPSPDFTSKIMAQVSAIEKPRAILYKPLISKTAWAAIFGIMAAIIGYAVYGNSEKSQFGISLSAKISSLIPKVHFSDTASYAVLTVVFMVLIQISLLKNYFDRRLE